MSISLNIHAVTRVSIDPPKQFIGESGIPSYSARIYITHIDWEGREVTTEIGLFSKSEPSQITPITIEA